MIFLFVFIGCCGGTLFHTFVSPYSPSPQTYNQSAFSTFDLDAVPSAVGGADCVAVRSQQPPSTAAWGVALWASPVDQQSNKIIFAPYSLLVGGLFQSDVSGVYNNVQQLSNTSLAFPAKYGGKLGDSVLMYAKVLGNHLLYAATYSDCDMCSTDWYIFLTAPIANVSDCTVVSPLIPYNGDTFAVDYARQRVVIVSGDPQHNAIALRIFDLQTRRLHTVASALPPPFTGTPTGALLHGDTLTVSAIQPPSNGRLPLPLVTVFAVDLLQPTPTLLAAVATPSNTTVYDSTGIVARHDMSASQTLLALRGSCLADNPQPQVDACLHWIRVGKQVATDITAFCRHAKGKWAMGEFTTAQ